MIRALLGKDLRVLRRSPALLALIVLYPVLIAVGLGLALTRDPQPPKIAVVNLLPDGGQGKVTIGGQTISVKDLEQSIAGGDVQSTNLPSREAAVVAIEAGTIDGALIIPKNAANDLRAALETGGVTGGPRLEVLYRSSGPLDGTLVRAVIASRLRTAERAVSGEIVRVASGFLEILRDGGTFEIAGTEVSVIGLRAAEILVAAGAEDVPKDQQAGLEQAARFARLARENLGVSDSILKSIAKPLNVQETAIGEGSNTTLSGFAVGAAAALSLMLVALTLGAGLLAGEREEGTLRRLLRGGHGAWRVATAKTLAAGLIAAGSGLLLLVGVAIFGATPWDGAAWWIPAVVLGGLACGALGVLLGAALRDARAATLAAILLAVPVAVIALIPDQTIGGSASTLLGAISAVLPFDPARDLLDAALAAHPDWTATLQLLTQAAVYVGAAGLVVRRSRA